MESKNITLTFEKDWYNSDSAALMEAALHIEIGKMESRNITLTLEKAKEWYNSGSADLKKVALQAYKEEELEEINWRDIKTFEDAYHALGVSHRIIRRDLERLNIGFVGGVKKHLIAVYKLDIIRKALNKGWNPKMMEDTIYYPHIRIYPIGQEDLRIIGSIDKKINGNFKVNDIIFSLVGGDYFFRDYGLSNLNYCSGDVHVNSGLLSCKSKEIAKHMSKYFAKEIFDACYAQHIGAYEWVIPCVNKWTTPYGQ